MKKVCKELIDFFQQREGWDKEELLSDYITEVQTELGIDPNISADEIGLAWGEDGELNGTLQDFASALFDKIIEGVCNVIETA